MLTNYRSWLRVSITLQAMTGVFQLLSFLATAPPANEEEKSLRTLMANYQFDLGAGFHRSMNDLMSSFSLVFSLFLFFTAALHFLLLRLHLPENKLKPLLLLSIIAYLCCFCIMSLLTFLPPIICVGLVLVTLLLSYILLLRQSKLI